jgi:hypothetical protein
MKEHLDSALQSIEEDYKVCLRIIGRYYDYLDTCGLKEFNRYSKYKWSFDRDRNDEHSYVCIRDGSSLVKKSLVQKRAYIKEEDLYNWTENKELIQEALDEAHQFIIKKVSSAKSKIEAMKVIAENFEDKLEIVSEDFEEVKTASKKLGGEDLLKEEEPKTGQKHISLEKIASIPQKLSGFIKTHG